MSVLNRTYNVDSLLCATSGTTALPILYFATTATADMVLCRLYIGVEATSNQSASPSTNNSILFQLSTVTGTVGGGGAVTPHQQSGTALAANTTFTSANGGAVTGLTQTTEWWSRAISLSAGSWWEGDWTNTGLEVPVPVSSKMCFYITTASGAGTNLSARVEATFTE